MLHLKFIWSSFQIF